MKRSALYIFALTFGTSTLFSQTLDTAALDAYNPAVVRQVYEIARYVHLTGEQQTALADFYKSQDKTVVKMVSGNGGTLSVKDGKKLEKSEDTFLAGLLGEEALAQYYRGVFDAASNAEGNAIADKLQKEYNLTDQNWKFIRIAFYKIALESRVINKLHADSPAQAKRMIAKLRKETLQTIEDKGGIRVNDDMTITVVRPFDPNTLHK